MLNVLHKAVQAYKFVFSDILAIIVYFFLDVKKSIQCSTVLL